MSHQNLRSGKRSGEMIRENGRNTMIRNAYWGVLASILVALAFATGCTSTSATPPPVPITTVTIPSTAVPGQNAVVNTGYTAPLTVLVSTNGTPVVGVPVIFSAPITTTGATGIFTSSGSTSMTATTDANGLATSSGYVTPATNPPSLAHPFVANNLPGTYIVIATTVGSTSTAQFSMFNTLQPQGITVAGGSPQSTSFSTQFNSQLAATVTHGGTSVGQGLPVTFTNASSNGTFADTQTNTTVAITNPSGVATAAPFTADATVTGAGGQYTITATTIDNDPNSTTFTLSTTIVPATITAAGSSTPQTAAVSTPFAPLTVTVMDGSTPPVPVGGALVVFSAPSFTVDSKTGLDSTSSGTFADSGTTTTTAWTDASGVATAAVFTANALASPTATGATSPTPYNVSATVVVKAGTTLSVNFVLTNQ